MKFIKGFLAIGLIVIIGYGIAVSIGMALSFALWPFTYLGFGKVTSWILLFVALLSIAYMIDQSVKKFGQEKKK